MKKVNLTVHKLIEEAKNFCISESNFKNIALYGITDGKAVGTFIEHKYKENLRRKYKIELGSSANGIDLPGKYIQTDIKVTSFKQPQSSCPFKSAEQKIFGLGYNLLVFVYNKVDFNKEKYAILDFVSCSFIGKDRTGDYTTTARLNEMINDGAIKEDIIAYLIDRNLPADEIMLNNLAERIINQKPKIGYLTISNALQWRLQYQRIVNLDVKVTGITKIIDKIKSQ